MRKATFRFKKVLDGAWFILADVKWAVGSNNFGSPLVREIKIPQQDTTQVLLTKKDLPSYDWPMKMYEFDSFFQP